MWSVEGVAPAIANAAVLVILAVLTLVYGIPRILQELGFRPKSADSKAVESLSSGLEASLETWRSTVGRIDALFSSMNELGQGLRIWQEPVVQRLDRIEQLIREGEGKK